MTEHAIKGYVPSQAHCALISTTHGGGQASLCCCDSISFFASGVCLATMFSARAEIGSELLELRERVGAREAELLRGAARVDKPTNPWSHPTSLGRHRSAAKRIAATQLTLCLCMGTIARESGKGSPGAPASGGALASRRPLLGALAVVAGAAGTVCR